MTLTVTYAGHATVLVALDGERLLTDPVLGDRVGHLRRVARPASPELVRDLDAILISHAHADHLDPRSLRRLTAGTRVIVPRGAARWLPAELAGAAVEVRAGDRVPVGALTVRATPARHGDRRWPWGGRADPVGYVVEGSQSVYFAGDTDLFGQMAGLADDLDLALIPIAGWGPTLPPGHLDPERAAEALRRLRPRFAVPIHWGTLRPPELSPSALLGLARPHAGARDPAEAFVAHAASLAPEVEVRILHPGASLEIRAPAPRT